MQTVLQIAGWLSSYIISENCLFQVIFSWLLFEVYLKRTKSNLLNFMHLYVSSKDVHIVGQLILQMVLKIVQVCKTVIQKTL
jgi:hypothetical protein